MQGFPFTGRGRTVIDCAVAARPVLGAVLGFALVFGLLAGEALAQAPAGGIPVTVAAATLRDVPILLRNIGSVQANQTVLVHSRVDGTLEKVFFTEGQEVKAGDKIAQIDPRPYQAAFEQAVAKRVQDEVNLANAQQDLTRYQSLAQREFASRQQVDTQIALVKTLTAALRGDDAGIVAAKVNLDYTNILAPFDGRVGLRQIDPGNVIHASDPANVGIVTISQIHPITVIFTLTQDNLPAIQAAMATGKLPVFAYTPDNKTQLGAGTLLTIDNAVDPTTGTIKLKAEFQNPDNKLWPGQFVNAALQITVQKGAVTVPSAAVQHNGDGLFIYVLKPDSTVAQQPVKAGQDDGQVAVITENIAAGAQVVINGQSRLQNGTKVAVNPAKPNS